MKKQRRLWLRLLLLVVWLGAMVGPLLAQPPMVFHHLTTKEGLSNGSVNALLKDSYGYLWVGTQYGLNRYDGYGFRVSTTATSAHRNAMFTNNIGNLQEDARGNIWISAYNYMVYNRALDRFVADVPGFLSQWGIETSPNYRVFIDKRRNLWVFSGSTLFSFNFETESLARFNLEIACDDVDDRQFCEDEQFLYVILNSGLVWKVDKQTGVQSPMRMPAVEKLDQYLRILSDSKGGFWLAGKSDVVYYKKQADSNWEPLLLKSKSGVHPNRVLALIDDGKGTVWIGTDHNGLFVFNTINKSLSNYTEDRTSGSSMASNNVTCMYRDDEGIVWIGHGKKGISYHHSSFQNILNFKHPACRDVSVMLEDRQGRIWLCTDGNGLFRKGRSDGDEIQQLPIGNAPVVSILEDRDGRVWAGTFMDGLYCFDGGRIEHYTTENSLLASNDIWSMKEDRYGNLWIGSLGGGLQVMRAGLGNLQKLETVCDAVNHPMDLYYDMGDKLYVATVFGLYVVDISTGDCTSYFGNKKGTQNFKQNLLTSVFKDSRGLLWMGHNEGITVWDLESDSLYYVDRERGMRDNIVQGLVEDAHQNMWAITSNGLSVLTLEPTKGSSFAINCRNFTTKDGLNDNYFNNHAITKLRNGDIMLGGAEGYSIVNPNKMMERNQPLRKVLFTRLSIGNSEIKVDSSDGRNQVLQQPMEKAPNLRFKHSDKLIAIHFTTGDLLYADKVRFAYKLEGFHNEWQTTSENRVVFSSLRPGAYTLLVKACNSDGVWNEKASSLGISVAPPFYLSRWAFILYLLVFVGLVTLVLYRILKKQYEKLELQRLQLERDQKANLDEMKLRFFTNVSHDLRTPLTLILTPLQSILNEPLDEKLRKKLEIIGKNAEQLLQLINSLLDFRKLDVGAEVLQKQAGDWVNFIKELCLHFQGYANERRIRFDVTSVIPAISVEFDRAKMGKVVSNLLSNAFKFTPDQGRVEVRIFQEDGYVCLSVSDTGAGISDTDKKLVFERFFQAKQGHEKTGSGIGLHIAHEYVALHGGVISVEDHAPHGSTFVVKLPWFSADAEAIDLNEELADAPDLNEEPQQPSRPVLLFVDDNKDLCEFMADSLSDEFAILLANDGQEALKQLNDNDVNIVVSDVMMPVMDGIELCKKIKNNIQWSHIPVILLTARTAEEYQLQGLEMGADDYLTKPFNFNLLKLRVHKFLEWTEKSHRSFSQKMDVEPSEITITPLDEQLIAKAIKVVEEHISDPDFSVEELSSAVGLSRGYLYKKLMSITGKGPAEFIRTIRLKRGRQLLEKSQMQIAEIAYAVGYNSPKRFTINFKSEFGVSPSDYLRNFNKAE